MPLLILIVLPVCKTRIFMNFFTKLNITFEYNHTKNYQLEILS